ncbi:hypothetical protein BH11PSE11_BH11PSE11_12220 [soil metagenome]
MSIPKVFISYSHDSTEHKAWVLDLSTRLMNFGVDVTLDQWDLRAGDDLVQFMETHVKAAHKVLMICTEKYVEKANAGTGGVGYEKMIVTADLLARMGSNKIIPLIRQVVGDERPTFLQTKKYIDFSRQDQFEFSFDELVRTLHDAPLYEKPSVTKSPFPVTPKPATPTTDGLKELMGVVVQQFESTADEYLEYEDLVNRFTGSRVMLDLLFGQAIQRGLLIRNGHDYFQISGVGKQYAVENNLIKT